MAKQGFKVMDSDMHVIEPPDLWQNYMEPAYRDRAPWGTRNSVRDISIQFADGMSGSVPDMQYDVQYSLLCATDDERGPGDDASVENPGNIFEQLIESFVVLPVE